jgi:hypothetical protein
MLLLRPSEALFQLILTAARERHSHLPWHAPEQELINNACPSASGRDSPPSVDAVDGVHHGNSSSHFQQLSFGDECELATRGSSTRKRSPLRKPRAWNGMSPRAARVAGIPTPTL